MLVDAKHRELWKKSSIPFSQESCFATIVPFEDFLALSSDQFPYLLSEEITEGPCGKD